MDTRNNTGARDVGALVATLFAIVLVGLFALMLVSRNGSADNAVNAGPSISEQALPQGQRYPQTNEKFAPDRIVPTATPVQASAPPALCQGEGLRDTVGPCRSDAYPAGGADADRPLGRLAEGQGGVSPRD